MGSRRITHRAGTALVACALVWIAFLLLMAPVAGADDSWEERQKELEREHWAYTKRSITEELTARSDPSIAKRVNAAYVLSLDSNDDVPDDEDPAFLDRTASEVESWLAGESEFWVRYYLVDALAELDRSPTRSRILPFLDDPDPSFKALAASHIRGTLDPDVEQRLIRAYEDRDPWWVRSPIVLSLGGGTGPESMHLLRRALLGPGRDVQAAASCALSRRPDPENTPYLIQAIVRGTLYGRESPVEALSAFPDPMVLLFLQGTAASPSPLVRQLVARSMATIHADASFVTLKMLLEDSDATVRQAAAESLTELGGPEAAVAVIAWLAREHNEAVFAKLRSMDDAALIEACGTVRAKPFLTMPNTAQAIAICAEIDAHRGEPPYFVFSTADLHSWLYSPYNADAREVVPASGRRAVGWRIAVGTINKGEKVRLRSQLQVTNWGGHVVRYREEVWLQVTAGPYGGECWVKEADLKRIPLDALTGRGTFTDYGAGSVMRVSPAGPDAGKN